jgi:hypothetical protein
MQLGGDRGLRGTPVDVAIQEQGRNPDAGEQVRRSASAKASDIARIPAGRASSMTASASRAAPAARPR